jgi:hypothetical protein
MSMTFTNPYSPFTLSDVQVVWNAATGGTGNPKTLTIQSATLGGLFWNGSDSTGSITITPAATVTIPGNNTSSSIIFTFDKNYVNRNGSESIIIHLSTPGCENFTIHSP